MYEGISACGHTQGGETHDFPITICLPQGSTLNSYLFTLILDVFTKHIQELAMRCIFFADEYIVLLGELTEDLNKRLET